MLDRPAVAAELSRAGINSAVELISLFLMDRAEILKMSEGVPLNTDDNMYIEYSTASKLHLETRGENVALLLKHARLPELAFDNDPDQWARLAASYRRRGDVARSIAAMSRATQLSPSEDRSR